MRLDRDQIGDPGADKHDRGGNTLQAVAGDRVNRLQDGPELVWCVLVGDARALVEIFAHADKTFDVLMSHAGVAVRTGGRLESQFAVGTVDGEGARRDCADANHGYAVTHTPQSTQSPRSTQSTSVGLNHERRRRLPPLGFPGPIWEDWYSMDFQLTDEQRMIQATVREFATKEILPRAAALDHFPTFPAEIIQKAAALGLMGMMVPERYGGAGVDAVSYVLVQEELARASEGVQTLITVNNSLVCDPIVSFGTEEQKRRYLPRLSSGASLGCYCLTEPAYGSDAMSLQVGARRDGGEWVLRGTKIFVTNGVEADVCIVYARTGPEPGARGISAFIVEKRFPGISVGKVEKKLGIKCSSTAEIVLDDCRVPASNVVGEPGTGGEIALSTLDAGRLGIVAPAVGRPRGAVGERAGQAARRQAV